MQLQRQIDQLLALRASEWHQILEHATDEQRAEFVAWLKQSPLHVQEYLETVYADRLLGHLDEERIEDVDALVAQISPSVVTLKKRAPGGSPFLEGTGGGAKRRYSRFAALAALVVCVVTLPFLVRHFGAGPEYSTTLGEQRTVQLPDSSVVTLNADSRIQLNLDQAHRNIDLLRGEALFQVAQDPHRPFIVETRTALVQAVGTQFNVYDRPSGTRISVLDGRVRITALEKDGSSLGKDGSASAKRIPATQELSAGQEAQVMPDGTIQRNTKADVTKTVAWRERHLIFDDAPLEDMVYEFNRYNRATRLVLDGVPPGSHHYNGVFDAADPQSLADLLSREPDLVVERRDGEIVIRKR